MFFQCFVAIALFYCAHWQTYVSGSLRFGKFDVTEAQFSVMIIHLISAIFGPGVWATRLPMLNVELRLVPVAVALSVSLIMCYTDIAVILSGGVGKNGSTVAGTSVLSPSIPIALVVVPAFIIYQKSTTSIYENHPCLYIIAFGMVAAKVTNRLVVAHMCRSEMDYMDSILIGPGMLFLNQYFNTFINEYVILWICLVYSAADLLHYCTIVCNQICGHLQIPLLRIAPKFPPSLVDRPPPNPSPGQSARLLGCGTQCICASMRPLISVQIGTYHIFWPTSRTPLQTSVFATNSVYTLHLHILYGRHVEAASVSSHIRIVILVNTHRQKAVLTFVDESNEKHNL
ncbi:unnamed protein product [Ixodes persulcatus]